MQNTQDVVDMKGTANRFGDLFDIAASLPHFPLPGFTAAKTL